MEERALKQVLVEVGPCNCEVVLEVVVLVPLVVA